MKDQMSKLEGVADLDPNIKSKYIPISAKSIISPFSAHSLKLTQNPFLLKTLALFLFQNGNTKRDILQFLFPHSASSPHPFSKTQPSDPRPQMPLIGQKTTEHKPRGDASADHRIGPPGCRSVQIKGKACFFRQPSGPSVRPFLYILPSNGQDEGKEKNGDDKPREKG
ncbi:hypothetical protein SLE2022_056630 [Rubroshorea leprosula]